MAKTLTSKLTLLIDALFTNAATGIFPTLQGQAQARSSQIALANGTGANQADLIYTETRTLGASASVTLDLAGVLTDIYGALITFARIKAIIILAAAANTNNVLMGAAAATQFLGPLGSATDVVNVRPGGWGIFVAPDATAWAVGAGATDFLKFANSAAGTGVTFDLAIIGASA
jgi:hypothetical protein